MKNIFNTILIIITFVLAILAIMFVLDLVSGEETKKIILQILEIGGIILLLSITVMYLSNSNKIK
jgi:RsiW-degrading membrane proteinase PrsW (M82 family)